MDEYGLTGVFSSKEELSQFISDTKLQLVTSSSNALFLAGMRWRKYIQKRSKQIRCSECGYKMLVTSTKCNKVLHLRQHVMADFLIAANAIEHAEVLLSRDRGFYKLYFPELKVIEQV